MKKTLKNILLIVFLMQVIFITSCASFFSINSLPHGDLIKKIDSPNEKYSVNIYLCSGNATTDFSIRGELVENNDKSKKNIYWAYHEQEAQVKWISDDIVSINGIKLDLSKNQIYDWRNE